MALSKYVVLHKITTKFMSLYILLLKYRNFWPINYNYIIPAATREKRDFIVKYRNVIRAAKILISNLI